MSSQQNPLILSVGLLLCSSWVGPAIVPGGERLEVRVERGSSVERTFEATHEMQVRRRRFFQEDREIVRRHASAVETLLEVQQRSVTDRILEVNGRLPTRVVRTFGTLNTQQGSLGEFMFGPRPPRTSYLEGQPVLLEWNEQASGFDCVLMSPVARGHAVLDCGEDMDFREFLPPGDVEPGECWRIPGVALLALLQPGGAAGLDVPPGPEWVVEQLPGHLWIDFIDGRMNATFVGVGQQDGARVARVELEGEIETRAQRAAGPSDQGLWTAMAYTVRARYRLRGELLWDLEAGGLHWVRLDGSCEVEKSLTSEFDWMGMANVTREELDLEGTSTFTACRRQR